MGELETPSIWRLEFSNDPENFVVLLSVSEADPASFYKDVAARVRASPGKLAFIFVHGYNVTFADAARRTAQMAYDLGFDGAPVFYSWPSQARYASYKVDETNAEWAVLDFKNFLEQFAKQSQADSIFLIAHSMGSRVLAGALKELVAGGPGDTPEVQRDRLRRPRHRCRYVPARHRTQDLHRDALSDDVCLVRRLRADGLQDVRGLSPRRRCGRRRDHRSGASTRSTRAASGPTSSATAILPTQPRSWAISAICSFFASGPSSAHACRPSYRAQASTGLSPIDASAARAKARRRSPTRGSPEL